MMMAAIPMASTVSTVSRRLSPFFTDELATASESTSAERRLAAVSNERRVRVDSSKKSVATTLPRRVGTLRIDRRSRAGAGGASSLGLQRSDPDPFVTDVDHLFASGGQVLADVVGTDGQL